MLKRLAVVLAGAFCSVAVSTPLVAQGRPEVIRGRVTEERGAAVKGAEIVVTRSSDGVIQTVVTDTAGAYAVRFAEGTGRYVLQVTAAGWRPFRRPVVRTGRDSVLTADVRLEAQSPVVLDGLEVRGQRRRPERGPEFGPETGAAEAFAEGVTGAIPPDQEGDLAAAAATVPGVMVTPQGLSVLGLGAGQTRTTLNGMAFHGTDVPRDAKTRTRVSTSTYDPARGGFSGAQLAVELAPGSPFTFRRGHVTLDAPPLQFTDPISERLGGRFTGLHLSAGGDGELVENRYYYNMALQASRRAADAVSLADAGEEVFRMAGVAPDSAGRALEILAAQGVPLRAAAPGSRVTESVSYIGRIDHTPRAQRTWSVTAYGRLSRSEAAALSPTVAPAAGGRVSSGAAAVQAAYSFYFGRNYLNETKSALSYTRDGLEPYLRVPSGFVQVASDFEGGTGGLATLSFGGSSLDSEGRTWTWETTNETQLYNRDGTHKAKLYVQSRLDRFSASRSANGLGTFVYSSLADLAASRPASYSRVFGTRSTTGGEWSGALAVGDLWRPSRRFQVLYGARLEANRFLSVPPLNSAVLETFGARTDAAPHTVYVSPRLGFTWVHGKAPSSVGYERSAVGSRFEGPTGVLRGGIGVFRNLLAPDLLSEAALATGLPGGVRRLVCLGDAVPTPNWSAYLDGTAAIPDACAGPRDETVFTDAAPGVRLFDDDYTAPRSWRGNLAWNSAWKGIGFSVEGTYSINVNQPGTADLNFAGRPVFTLSGEGDRPVFVSPASIVASTGAVSPVEARVSRAFGRVESHRSDLRSESGQLTLRIAPDLPVNHYFLNAAYTLSHARAQFRGFDGATFGSPEIREWAPSDYDARHQVLLQAGWGNRNVTLTLFAGLTSGMPFTPLVGGDVNGDGLANDRAFVFGPEGVPDSAFMGGIAALRSSAPAWARECLERYQGRAASRNGCRGPWTQALNARIELSSFLLRTRRVSAAVTLANPLGGVDQLLHGSRNLRGWGSQAEPDPVLYRVRGFDPASRRFQYEVNPRFGDTRSAAALSRAPFRLVIDINVNWGPSFESQQLKQSLRSRPAAGGGARVRLSVDSIKELYRRSVPDIYAAILEASDSLLLAPAQTQALLAAQARYQDRTDVIWTGLARYLALLPARHDEAEALRRQEEATDRVWEALRAEGATITSILSPLQQRMLPEFVTSIIHAKGKIRYRIVEP